VGGMGGGKKGPGWSRGGGSDFSGKDGHLCELRGEGTAGGKRRFDFRGGDDLNLQKRAGRSRGRKKGKRALVFKEVPMRLKKKEKAPECYSPKRRKKGLTKEGVLSTTNNGGRGRSLPLLKKGLRIQKNGGREGWRGEKSNDQQKKRRPIERWGEGMPAIQKREGEKNSIIVFRKESKAYSSKKVHADRETG